MASKYSLQNKWSVSYGGRKVANQNSRKADFTLFFCTSFSFFLLFRYLKSRLNFLWKCIFFFSIILSVTRKACFTLSPNAGGLKVAIRFFFIFFFLLGQPMKVLVYWTHPNVSTRETDRRVFCNGRILLDVVVNPPPACTKVILPVRTNWLTCNVGLYAIGSQTQNTLSALVQ